MEERWRLRSVEHLTERRTLLSVGTLENRREKDGIVDAVLGGESDDHHVCPLGYRLGLKRNGAAPAGRQLEYHHIQRGMDGDHSRDPHQIRSRVGRLVLLSKDHPRTSRR